MTKLPATFAAEYRQEFYVAGQSMEICCQRGCAELRGPEALLLRDVGSKINRRMTGGVAIRRFRSRTAAITYVNNHILTGRVTALSCSEAVKATFGGRPVTSNH